MTDLSQHMVSSSEVKYILRNHNLGKTPPVDYFVGTILQLKALKIDKLLMDRYLSLFVFHCGFFKYILYQSKIDFIFIINLLTSISPSKSSISVIDGFVLTR